MRRRLTSPLDPLHVRYGVEPLPASSSSVLYWQNRSYKDKLGRMPQIQLVYVCLWPRYRCGALLTTQCLGSSRGHGSPFAIMWLLIHLPHQSHQTARQCSRCKGQCFC